MTLLLQYQELAATTQDILRTDIPQDVLGDFAELAFKVKDAGLSSVVFDDTVIRPAYPDYDKIRSLVQQSLAAAPPPSQAPADDDASAAAGGTTSSGSGGGSAPNSGSAGTDSSGTAGPAETTPVDNVTDACAYDRVQAEQALDEGEPPTRRRR
jgi:hypothetical protein